MDIKEVAQAVKFIKTVNPKAKLYYNNGRDGNDDLFEVMMEPMKFGNTFHLVVTRQS